MPILLDIERQGVPVDLKQLKADIKSYTAIGAKVDAWVIKKLKAPKGINLNSGAQLFNALCEAGKVDLSKAKLTKTGQYSTAKDALLEAVSDKQLLAMLHYRSQLNTCLNTFMKRWVTIAEATGLIYCQWNQVKGGEGLGARTGRLSSTPNFQNLANEFQPIFKHDTKDAKLKRSLPSSPIKGLPTLPRIRSYVLPFKGDVLIDRDYSQQEPRILAHFEDGVMLENYRRNPWIDFHTSAQETLQDFGKSYPRKAVKAINLGLLYGMGLGTLAEEAGLAVDEMRELKSTLLSMYPGLSELIRDLKLRAASNLPMRTWGGREYICEEPFIHNGRMRKLDYKMINTLIQGSAGDCTKQAIINYYNMKKPNEKLILNVHDQLTSSVPKRQLHTGMERLRIAMEDVDFDVPMLSEGCYSSANWQDLVDYDKKGKRL